MHAQSGELLEYLERKAICMVEGATEEQAIEIAYEQIKGKLTAWVPDIIAKDIKRLKEK
jgi:hypothetical protein